MQYPLSGTDEEDLSTRLQQAQDAVRARDEFLAIAAHELRSPLNALALRLAALERLAARRDEPQLQAEIARTRRIVDRYVRRAVVLLDVSHLNSPEVHVARDWVGVRELVDNVVEAHRDEAAFHGAQIEAQIETDFAGYWDPRMLDQILGNLVNNAIKYGRGAPVWICASLAEPGFARLEVADAGPGIEAAQRARIFEKFERVVSGARDRSGFGLGLWIVGRMVAAHQGRIDVTERPGGGSRFVVTLPLGRAEQKD